MNNPGYILVCFFVIISGCAAEDKTTAGTGLDSAPVFKVAFMWGGRSKRVIPDLEASVSIDDNSPLKMTINNDEGTASVSISGLLPGEHRFHVIFSKSGVTLAEKEVSATIVAGKTITVPIESLDTNLDDDNDGFTNLAEVLAGTLPQDADDNPGFDLPPVISTSASGIISSGTVEISSGLGGYLPDGKSETESGVEVYSFFQ